MNKEEQFKSLKEVIAKVNSSKASKVKLQSDLVKDGILDSIEIVSLVFELEEAYSCKFDDSFNDFRVETLLKFVK